MAGMSVNRWEKFQQAVCIYQLNENNHSLTLDLRKMRKIEKYQKMTRNWQKITKKS